MQEETRRISRLLFGSSYRLPVAALIARVDLGVVSAIAIMDELKLSAATYSAVRKELEYFAEAGILAKLPRPAGQRVQEYERLPTAYWELARQVAEEIERSSGTRRSMRTER